MIIGTTGTRRGMSILQQTVFTEVLIGLIAGCAPYEGIELAHGDCVGSDEDAVRLFKKFRPGGKIISHPPDKGTLRANIPSNVVKPPKPYLHRNKDIVLSCDVLIATPYTPDEVVRSGTWATVRFAREQRRKLFIIKPNGDVSAELAPGRFQ